jgi:hypothetical protein
LKRRFGVMGVTSNGRSRRRLLPDESFGEPESVSTMDVSSKRPNAGLMSKLPRQRVKLGAVPVQLAKINVRAPTNGRPGDRFVSRAS